MKEREPQYGDATGQFRSPEHALIAGMVSSALHLPETTFIPVVDEYGWTTQFEVHHPNLPPDRRIILTLEEPTKREESDGSDT